MSADNWAVCPRCWANAKAEHAEEEVRVADLYGKVSVGEFDTERNLLAQRKPSIENFYTFREDYEFSGAETGTVEAIYEGVCSECGLSAKLRSSETFWESGEGAD